MGEGEVEDGIRVCCMSTSISAIVGCRVGPILECRLDDDGGGGVAIDSRRRLDGCAREPFSLPNILPSSSGDARKIVSFRPKAALGFSRGLAESYSSMSGGIISQNVNGDRRLLTICNIRHFGTHIYPPFLHLTKTTRILLLPFSFNIRHSTNFMPDVYIHTHVSGALI